MNLYDKIGAHYNKTRTADPYIAKRLYQLLEPVPGGLYADIGCGTGNYLHALASEGLTLYGIDPSETMLKQARMHNPDVRFIKAVAEHIPLADGFFNGAIAVLTVHHWDNMLHGLKEACRILRPGSRFVLFSFTPAQMRGYWLNHYFPEMMEKAMAHVPSKEDMLAMLTAAGFSSVVTHRYFVRADLQDQFMYSNKYKPENYLLPGVRRNASAFALLASPEEVEGGVARLQADIVSGKINEVIQQYENDLGDYIFIAAQKV
jgi:SAM-dependent methyltransferase